MTFQKSGKQDILKGSASMSESSGSLFLKTTTGIQSRSDASNESSLTKTFSTILGVEEILCSFRLVLEDKTSKEIPKSSRLEFLERFLAYQMQKTILVYRMQKKTPQGH